MEKLQNIGNFTNINDYVSDKINRFAKSDKTLASLFEFMFSEKQNIFAELSKGYRIEKITYGECYDDVLRYAKTLDAIIDLPKNSIVGLALGNSLIWIQTFWALICAGYRPLLVNTRLSCDMLDGIFSEYSINLVISDDLKFKTKTLEVSSIIKSQDCDFSPKFSNEIFFMSSGTTDNVKLCAYNGENLFYQVENSAEIIKNCPQMKKHYNGQIKQLALLPFYHIFGFSAVYLWFCFFSRTLVFLKDIRPQTLLSTINAHKVTHIFAVPLVWETIYKEAMKKIQLRGEKTYNKFKKALRLANKSKFFKSLLTKSAFKEIRDNLFGDSISYLISGGSVISEEVLSFFNGIGYNLANGYGMTEVGITSVELSSDCKIRNSASIGLPFGISQYEITENNELLIKSKARANKILQGGKTFETDYDSWFNTCDLVKFKNGAYYVQGRVDDLIVGRDGENINPIIIENSFKLDNAESVCLLKVNDEITLLIQGKNCFLGGRIEEIELSAKEEIKRLKLETVINKIIITADSLVGDEYKISRNKLSKRLKSGDIRQLSSVSDLEYATTKLEKEICEIISQTLDIDDNFDINADFFMDLNGSSLDFFTLVNEIKTRFGVDISTKDEKEITTVKSICDRLQKK